MARQPHLMQSHTASLPSRQLTDAPLSSGV